MAHVLILGITSTGKTTLATDELCPLYKSQGTSIIVLDPDLRKEWGVPNLNDIKKGESITVGVMTDDPEKFLEICKKNQSCALFIDESGQTIGRYAGPMQWVATNSRKWGHKAHFITQRATQLDPTIRAQCTSIFLFKQSVDDAKILAREFVAPELMESCNLLRGEYLAKLSIDSPVRRGKTKKK